MKRLLAALALAALSSQASAAVDGPRADKVVAAAGFSGVALIGQGESIRWQTVTADRSPALTTESVWRLASVTKQLTALIVMQEVAAGHIDLDTPIKTYWPEWPAAHADAITPRMLLRHQSGLVDPADDKQDKDGVPGFYRRAGAAADPHASATGFCAANPRGAPPMDFHYNNCDFIVLGSLLERVTGKPFATLLDERIAQPLGLTSLGLFAFDAPAHANIVGFDRKGVAEPALNLGTYGAAGSAYIAPTDLWAFDRALMENRLLDKVATAEMWKGDPALGAAALGAWSFTVPLAGCADPVALVERRGAIGGVQVRNFLAPATHTAVILFTDYGDFDFGEVWQGAGFSYDMLSAALCPAPTTAP